jgi:hypothetical protein
MDSTRLVCHPRRPPSPPSLHQRQRVPVGEGDESPRFFLSGFRCLRPSPPSRTKTAAQCVWSVARKEAYRGRYNGRYHEGGLPIDEQTPAQILERSAQPTLARVVTNGQLRTKTKHKRKPLCHRRRAPRAGEGLAPQFPWLIGCYVFHRGPLKKLRKVIDCHTQSSAIGS